MTTLSSQVESVETGIRTLPLGEVLTVDARSVAPNKISDGTTYLGLESIGQGGTVDESVVVKANELKSAKFAFDHRHVLYGKLRPNLGKVARPTGEGVCSTDIYPLLPREGLDRNYLAHYLLGPETIAKAASRTTGVNLPRISAAVLKTFDIPLPPLPEQRRIADILDRADDLRAKRRRALALLDELTARFVSQLAMDREWPIRALQDLATTQGGLTVNRKRVGLPQEVGYLRVANVARGSIDVREVKKIGVTRTELERVALRDGDLLVVEGHGNALEVGRAARWTGVGPMAHQNHLIRVRPNPGVLDSVYAEHFFNSQMARSYFRSVSKTTSGLNTINMSNVKSLPVLVPPLDVQLAFSEKVRRVEDLRLLHRAELAKLDELFASLQHRAFSGRL